MPSQTRRSRLLARLLVCALASALLVAVPPVAPHSGASSVYLCSGYTGCGKAGYSHAGYGTRSNKMYWRMYAGHNCTNYAAYRMIQAGMSTERPWSGSGMAYNWGYAMSGITDKVPSVGAIAWWDRHVSGAGSSGHVAYVEQVVSPTEIIISEDSWSGDFHWRRIIKDGSGWPTGFIHFVDKTIANAKAPSIEGTPRVGETLRANPGAWKPGGVTKKLQWLANGVPIAGATRARFSPTAAQVGAALSVRVSVSKSAHTPASADSAPTAPVGEGQLVPQAPPSLAGTAEVEEVLRAVPGTWSPAPDTTAFRWKADGKVIKGASGPTLTLGRAHVGKKISIVEVARREGFVKANAATAPVGPVVEGRIEVQPFTASGSARHGASLTFTPGAYRPADATVAYTWMRDGVAVPGATGATYPIGTADVGRTLSVQATLSKPRHASVRRSAVFGTITTPSAVVVRANGKKRKMAVGVSVKAPGTVPSGTVTVRVGKHVVTGRLVQGRVRVVVPGLVPGTRTVRVAYEGDGVAERASSRASAKVLR